MEGLAKHYVGDNFVNIGTYVATAVAMVVGSLLKPLWSPGSTSPTAVATKGGTP